MNFEFVKNETITLCGISIELTNSQNKNYELIRKHWVNFNAILKTNQFKAKSNWRKYGITLKIEGKYFYMSAIPYNISCQDFETITISEGISARFLHIGSMENIKTTVYTIYKRIVPEKQLQVDSDRKILHYELYDHRFHWNKDNSVIEIYLPLIG